MLQILTLFESVIKRDFLKSDFTTTDEHLSSCSVSGNVIHDQSDVGSVLTLPWIPRTSAALALRLFEVDASIYYIGCEKPEPDQYKETGEYMVCYFFSFCLLQELLLSILKKRLELKETQLLIDTCLICSWSEYVLDTRSVLLSFITDLFVSQCRTFPVDMFRSRMMNGIN